MRPTETDPGGGGSQFFGSAFMSFMAVAYVPAFLEDSAMYEKETANGLYGSAAFIVSNFFIGLPYLCVYCHTGPFLCTLT